MNPNDEISALENIIDQILAALEEVARSGEILDDAIQGRIAEELLATQQRITELRQQTIQQLPPDLGEKPSPGAQLMWILAGQKPEAFISYLGTYPDPELNALLRNPTRLQQTLGFLTQMMPQTPENRQADGIPHADLNSSNVYGFKYDPKSGRLLVRFQSGSVYGYDGVPPEVFKVFQSGAIPAKTTGQNQFGKWWTGKIPSLGAAFYELIRQGGYPYQRLK